MNFKLFDLSPQRDIENGFTALRIACSRSMFRTEVNSGIDIIAHPCTVYPE